MPLFVSAVRAPHERAGEYGAEAERLSLLAEPAELVRMPPAVDRRVLRARLEVLADRHDVDAVRAQVAHRVDDLVVRLAEPDNDRALGEDVVVGDLLRACEEPEGAVVARLRAAHVPVQAAHSLDVEVEDFGTRAEHRAQRVLLDT